MKVKQASSGQMFIEVQSAPLLHITTKLEVINNHHEDEDVYSH